MNDCQFTIVNNVKKSQSMDTIQYFNFTVPIILKLINFYIYFAVQNLVMKKYSSSNNLILKPKHMKPLNIRKTLKVETSSKENQTQNKEYEIIRIKSSNRIIIRNSHIPEVCEKKKFAQPHRKLIKARVATEQDSSLNKETFKLFRVKKNLFTESQRHTGDQQPKPFKMKKLSNPIKESRIQRKLIIRNPFQKKKLCMQFHHLTTCDESEIAFKSQMSEDGSQINTIFKTFD